MLFIVNVAGMLNMLEIIDMGNVETIKFDIRNTGIWKSCTMRVTELRKDNMVGMKAYPSEGDDHEILVMPIPRCKLQRQRFNVYGIDKVMRVNKDHQGLVKSEVVGLLNGIGRA